MRTIYIDSDFRCHIANGEGRTAVETEFFDGKCDEFVEGYRFIPAGQTWTRADGKAFLGQMIAPWMSYSELERAQTAYERDILDTSLALLEELGVTI